MDQEMKNFIGLSAVLTGFNESIIAPQLDPVDIKTDYLAAFNTNIGSALVSSILAKYQELKSQGKSDQEIGEAMLDDSNGTDFVMACRQLIFLWYSGAWPTIIPAANGKQASTVSTLLSSKSYSSGLAWQVMQSHPMGDSNYRYGYWSEKPADLSDYTGNTTKTTK